MLKCWAAHLERLYFEIFKSLLKQFQNNIFNSLMKESKSEIYPKSRSLSSVPIYSKAPGKLSQRKSFELNFLQKQIISEVLTIWSENNRSGIGSITQYWKCVSNDRVCQRGHSPELLWEPGGAELHSHLEDPVQGQSFQVGGGGIITSQVSILFCF